MPMPGPPCDFAQVTGADQAGQQFVQTLHEHGLWLPSTFNEYHAGLDATFQHPCGQEHRLDCVALGGLATCCGVSSGVATDFDTANKLEDHRAVELESEFTAGPVHDMRKLYRPSFDRQLMRTEEGKSVIQQATRNYVPPSWTVGVDKHCQHLQDYLLDILEKNFTHFTLKQGGPRASYISGEVWIRRSSKLHLKDLASSKAPPTDVG